MKSSRALAALATWFLYAFCADAVISVSSDILRTAGVGVAPLDALRNLVALTVVLWALVLFAVIFITPRVRKRFLLPPVLFALWAGITGCFPLLLLALPHTILLLSILQLAISAAALIPHLRGTPLIAEHRPAFSWWNLASGAAVTALFACVWAASLLGSVAQAVEISTAGFLRVRPSGLYLEERTFRKDNKEIRLIAMIHVAQGSFYEDLAAGLKDSSATVLLEGVSDEKGLLKKGLSYHRVADALGIDAQENSSFTEQAREALENNDGKSGPLTYRHADIDISAFRPQTIAVINALSDLISSKSFRDAIRKLQNPQSPFHNEEDMKIAFSDITDLRNEHLLATVRESLATSDIVIVPWGALHMPFLAAQLQSQGFEEVSRKSRRAFAFGS